MLTDGLSLLYVVNLIFQILAAMQRELAASGLSPEEILAKTLLLQKAMAGDNSPAFINKTLKNALNVANLNNADLTKVRKIYFLLGRLEGELKINKNLGILKFWPCQV